MSSHRYNYIGPYLKIERVMHTVADTTHPICCGASYRAAEKFCAHCGKALVLRTRQTQEAAVNTGDLADEINEALCDTTSMGMELDETYDLWRPNGGLEQMDLPTTDDRDDRAACELDAGHIGAAKRCFREQFAEEIKTINQAYAAVGGKPGKVVYGVLTYWM